MNPATRKKLVFATLPIAIVVAVINFTMVDSPGEKKSSPGPADEYKTAAAIPLSPVPSIDFNKYEKLGWGRDPFAGSPAATKEIPVPEKRSQQWRLGGILIGNGAPTAVINGKIVSAGDIVDGARVKEIMKDSVILEINGETKTVSIAGEVS